MASGFFRIEVYCRYGDEEYPGVNMIVVGGIETPVCVAVERSV